jgi:hypothetical protein
MASTWLVVAPDGGVWAELLHVVMEPRKLRVRFGNVSAAAVAAEQLEAPVDDAQHPAQSVDLAVTHVIVGLALQVPPQWLLNLPSQQVHVVSARWQLVVAPGSTYTLVKNNASTAQPRHMAQECAGESSGEDLPSAAGHPTVAACQTRG